MKKFMLGTVAVMLLACFSFSSCSKEERQNAIWSLLENGVELFCSDSTTFLSGVWAYQSGDGKEIDTLWIGKDSTILDHYISIDDTLDIQQSGGYLYYKSFKQVLVQYNHGFNYKTNRDLVDWNITNIYKASKWKIDIMNINQLVLEELDQTSGESLGSITYTFVEDYD